MGLGRWAVGAAKTGYAISAQHASIVGTATAAAASGRGALRGSLALARAGNLARHDRADGLRVGGTILHTGADREAALAQLATGFDQIAAELAQQFNAADPWILIDVAPALAQWDAFRSREVASWITRFATDWGTFVDWHERLKRLRELARAHGARLTSPEPTDLPRTIWERGAQGSGTNLDALLSVAKMVVYAAISVVSFVTLHAVIRDIRGPANIAKHQAQKRLAERSGRHT